MTSDNNKNDPGQIKSALIMSATGLLLTLPLGRGFRKPLPRMSSPIVVLGLSRVQHGLFERRRVLDVGRETSLPGGRTRRDETREP